MGTCWQFLEDPTGHRKGLSPYLPLNFANSDQIIGFGFILCLDSFLYTFTILPIRFFLALFRLLTSRAPLPPSQKADLLRCLLLILTIAVCVPLTDASKIYHTIRGQETIKLYVIYNALEVSLVHRSVKQL